MEVVFNIVTSLLLATIFVIPNGEPQNLPLDRVEVRLERMSCSTNIKYASIKICKVTPISRKIANMNVIFVLKRNITAVIYRSRSYHKFSNNEYRPMGVDLTTEFRVSQAGLLISPFHKLLQDVWGNHTNLLRPCPIPPGLYYVKDWNFSSRDLPSVILAGRYLWNVTAHNEFNEWLFNTSIYFYVANYGVMDLNIG